MRKLFVIAAIVFAGCFNPQPDPPGLEDNKYGGSGGGGGAGCDDGCGGSGGGIIASASSATSGGTGGAGGTGGSRDNMDGGPIEDSGDPDAREMDGGEGGNDGGSVEGDAG